MDSLTIFFITELKVIGHKTHFKRKLFDKKLFKRAIQIKSVQN